jgi:threonine aldolase
MYEAMMSAPLGDDVFREDPTTLELEQRAASLCGLEAGLFCASGTMTNQLAMRTHLRPLESAVIDHRGHIYAYEAGGVSFHSQAALHPLIPNPGFLHLTADVVEESIIPPGDSHQTPTRVISLENTLLGMVLPLEEIRSVAPE